MRHMVSVRLEFLSSTARGAALVLMASGALLAACPALTFLFRPQSAAKDGILFGTRPSATGRRT